MMIKKLTVQAVVWGALAMVAGCGDGAKAGAPAGPQAFPVKVMTA